MTLEMNEDTARPSYSTTTVAAVTSSIVSVNGAADTVGCIVAKGGATAAAIEGVRKFACWGRSAHGSSSGAITTHSLMAKRGTSEVAQGCLTPCYELIPSCVGVARTILDCRRPNKAQVTVSSFSVPDSASAIHSFVTKYPLLERLEDSSNGTSFKGVATGQEKGKVPPCYFPLE